VTPEDLHALWAAVTVPTAHGLNGRPLPGHHPVLVALDHDARRHLLIEVPSDAPVPRLHATRGLDISVDQLRVGDSPAARYIDLACTDSTLIPAFTAVAVDLHAAVDVHPHDIVRAVAATLTSWRWFWTVDDVGLTGESALGLFAELWFLERWLRLPDGVAAWVGPTGHRHDFVTATASVEAKGTRIRSDGAATHRIASLDQLDDPESGELWLFSLQVTPDPLAANTLPGLIQRIAVTLGPHPDALLALRERLAQAGWTPAHANRYPQAWRVVAEELYRVSAGFPRLTRMTFPGGIPAGVNSITYTIDLAACAPFRMASAPGQVQF
jgi:hypothetical protein